MIEHYLGKAITSKQHAMFETYYDYLTEWNQKINLTALSGKENVYLKHFVDSLTLVYLMKLDKQTLLDVGSGAGFPSIPLKILFPEIKITIVDSQKKRINFLKGLTEKLGINATLIHGRIETHTHKGLYDIVTARAVARLNALCELCVPFVKEDGHFVAYKGVNYEEELTASRNALSMLNATINKVKTFDVNEESRALIDIVKSGPTPKKYPRQFSKIKSNPL